MKVLVVEDDPGIVEVVSLCFQLRWAGTTVVTAPAGRKGVELVEAESPDVVILDVGLPDMDGYQVLKEIRRFSDVPVLMLTVRGEDTDIAKGLELGADDYITKPFSHIELIARVQAVLRRAQGLPVSDEEHVFTSGKLSVDLIRNEGHILSHESLLAKVWGDSYTDARDLLRVHIQHLRQKLGDNTESPTI